MIGHRLITSMLNLTIRRGETEDGLPDNLHADRVEGHPCEMLRSKQHESAPEQCSRAKNYWTLLPANSYTYSRRTLGNEGLTALCWLKFSGQGDTAAVECPPATNGYVAMKCSVQMRYEARKLTSKAALR